MAKTNNVFETPESRGVRTFITLRPEVQIEDSGPDGIVLSISCMELSPEARETLEQLFPTQGEAIHRLLNVEMLISMLKR